MSRPITTLALALLLELTLTGPPLAKAEPRIGLLAEPEALNSETKKLRDAARAELRSRSMSTKDLTLPCEPSRPCMTTALKSAGLERGIYVWLWPANDTQPEPVVGLMIQGTDGLDGFDRVAEERACAPSACKSTLTALLGEMLAAWPERKGTLLHLSGTPSGALVFDGAKLLGTLPGAFRLSRGEHRVRIAAPGHQSVELTLTAGPSPAEHEQIALSPSEPRGSGPRFTGTDPSLKDEPHSQKRAAMIGSGAALLAVGSTLGALGAASFAQGEQCDPGAPCQGYRDPSLGAGLMVGFGAAGLGTGLALMIRGIRNRKGDQ